MNPTNLKACACCGTVHGPHKRKCMRCGVTPIWRKLTDAERATIADGYAAAERLIAELLGKESSR